MRISSASTLRVDSRRGKQALFAVTALAVTAGLLTTDLLEEFVGYVLVTLASVAPTMLWLRMGAPGIPVLPIAGALYYLYYAVPMVTGNLHKQVDAYYSTEDILSAALTVTLFLAATTFFWWLLAGPASNRRSPIPESMSLKQFNRLIFPGFVFGLIYHVALGTGLMGAAGSFNNVLRTIAVSVLLVSCYTLGYGRARGIVFGAQWVLLLVILSIIILLAWSNLFLVDGLVFAGVAGAGYVFTCKRIPWRTCLFAFVLVGVLHAGKGEMRAKYWVEGTSASMTALPELMGEWLATGFTNLTSSKETEEGQSIIGRASLFWLLLRVQHATPDFVPYLGGETYAMMPKMIVPRFIKEDKLSTQAVMTLLNIRYGLQTAETAQNTAIGWGLIAEAFANFGNLGVAGIAMLIGLATGILMRGSIGQEAISLPSLMSVAALNTMINLEWDFSYVVLNTGQAFVSLTIFYTLSFAGLEKKQRALRSGMPGHLVTPPIAPPQGRYSADSPRLD